ncbi:MAG: hypothetical protein ACYCQK_10995, partial [Acidiferrobacteraceae bacterium]
DGLWEAIETPELARKLRSPRLDEALDDLLETAEDRMAERCDNASAVCLRWGEVRPLAKPLGVPKIASTSRRPVATPPPDLTEYGVDEAIAELEALVRRVPRPRE